MTLGARRTVSSRNTAVHCLEPGVARWRRAPFAEDAALAQLGIREAPSVVADRNDFSIAFAEDGSVVVNFGILSGREATQAELDRLALAFRRAGAGAEMTITAERRQDYAESFKGVIHQVRVTLEDSPTDWVEAICREWAVSCAEDRTVEPLDMF